MLIAYNGGKRLGISNTILNSENKVKCPWRIIKEETNEIPVPTFSYVNKFLYNGVTV